MEDKLGTYREKEWKRTSLLLSLHCVALSHHWLRCLGTAELDCSQKPTPPLLLSSKASLSSPDPSSTCCFPHRKSKEWQKGKERSPRWRNETGSWHVGHSSEHFIKPRPEEGLTEFPASKSGGWNLPVRKDIKWQRLERLDGQFQILKDLI